MMGLTLLFWACLVFGALQVHSADAWSNRMAPVSNGSLITSEQRLLVKNDAEVPTTVAEDSGTGDDDDDDGDEEEGNGLDEGLDEEEVDGFDEGLDEDITDEPTPAPEKPTSSHNKISTPAPVSEPTPSSHFGSHTPSPVSRPTTSSDNDDRPTLPPISQPTASSHFGSHTPSPVSQPTASSHFGSHTPSPVNKPSTDKHESEYVSTDDDPFKDDTNSSQWKWNTSTVDEMEHDETVVITLSVVFGLMLVFTIFVAHQMLQNPHGCCASICRCTVACSCGILRCVCYPCRSICGCTGQSTRDHKIISPDDVSITQDLELS